VRWLEVSPLSAGWPHALADYSILLFQDSMTFFISKFRTQVARSAPVAYQKRHTKEQHHAI
jgi:hypothetical protein